MNRPSLYDFMESHAVKGFTEILLHLYPKQERKLLNDGFSIERLESVEGYPQQHLCKVGWACPAKETYAYEFFELATVA